MIPALFLGWALLAIAALLAAMELVRTRAQGLLAWAVLALALALLLDGR